MSFLVNEKPGVINVYPDKDSHPHEMSVVCSCEPYIIINEGVSIIVHHPFDKRTITDEEKKQLGTK